MSNPKLKEDQQGVSPEGWMAAHFDTAWDTSESRVIRVAFRTIGSKKVDFWKNRWAASLTSRRGDVFPFGRMCHAELILPTSPGKYVKCSVIKKYWAGKDDAGRDIFKPGSVHCVETKPTEWRSKYVFLTMDAPRSDIARGVRFCVRNNGMPFNKAGYFANLVVPGGIGVRRFYPELMNTRRAYFCTEFICTALQAMVYEDIQTGRSYLPRHWRNAVRSLNPATSNPNMLYAKLKESIGVYDDTALGRSLGV